jgi:hypothetical protein
MITLVVADFRALFPQFASNIAFPDSVIQLQFDLATSYISASEYGDMSVAARTNALYMMTAHLLALNIIIASGGYTGKPGIVTQSRVGDVAVTVAQPPYGTSAWRYWLALTPYGVQLLALLEAQAVGGFYVGGLPERAAFRKVGGVF